MWWRVYFWVTFILRSLPFGAPVQGLGVYQALLLRQGFFSSQLEIWPISLSSITEKGALRLSQAAQSLLPGCDRDWRLEALACPEDDWKEPEQLHSSTCPFHRWGSRSRKCEKLPKFIQPRNDRASPGIWISWIPTCGYFHFTRL